MSTGSKHTYWRLLTQSALIGLVFVCTLSINPTVRAAAGINQQINFQGRLLNAQGATVPDGLYNIQFKIYQDGDGLSANDATGSPTGSLKWTESYLNASSQGVAVKNGYLSVQLGSITPFGSSIDWNQDTLWLSINIAGINATCTPFASCSPDGEMLPMKRLSSSPYSVNSGQLGGLTSAQFIQLAQGVQTDASTNTTSIYINKTGSGGNFIDLQASGADVFTLSNTGDVAFGANANHTISVAPAPASVAGKSLTITGGAAGTGASALAGGDLVLQGGTGGGANGNGGNVTIDAGAPNGSGTGGTVNIGTTNASSVNIATNASAHTIAIGNGAAAQSITIGSANSTSSLSIQAGSGGISLNGVTTVSGNFIVSNAGDVAFQRGTDFSTTGISNNVNFGSGTVIRLTGASAQTITGIAGGIDGRILTLVNAGSQAATVSSLNAGSTAGNQINTGTGNDVSLPAGSAMYLVYDSGTNVWRIVGSSGGGVQLQSSTPGVQQTGYFNISGMGIAGSFDSVTSGTLNLGATNAATINIGTNATAHTISIGNDSTTAQTIAIGSTSSTSSLLLQGGSNGISIGTGNVANTIQIGSTTLSSGTQTINLGTNNFVGGTTNVLIGSGSASTAGTTTLRAKDSITFGVNGVTRGFFDNANNFYLGNGAAAASPNSFTLQGTASATTGVAGGTLTIQGGGATVGTANGGNLALNAGAAIGGGTNGTISIGTTTASTITIGGTGQTGPITIQQQGISQVMTGSGSAPTDIIKTSTNSTGAFQVQNSASGRVLGIDTASNQVLLGQSSTLNGTLVFKNSTDSNGITLNSTGVTTSYILTLPSAAPSTGLCIETSSGNAQQLVFASCSNNNTNITEVQEQDANGTNTVSFSPFAVGDEIVVTTQIPTAGITVSGVSGGGTTNWTKAVVSAGNGTVHRVEMWVGTVSATGSSPIIVTYVGGSPGSEEVTATEFTAAGVNASTSWGIESTASQLNSTASTAVTFPSMVPINGAELYIGYGQVQNAPASATQNSPAGFSYIITSLQHNVIAYNPLTSANTPYQATASQASSGQSNTVSVVLTAFVTSTAINNATSIQKANFYVQSATGGAVAGVLQAASSGSADILNLRNSSAANVMTVGNTGATLFQNSTNSSTALQVQNTSNQSIFDVSTSGNTVVLGTSSSLGGSLTFNDANDSNSITLKAPDTIAASITLKLPNQAPTAGLCLGTSPSDPNQLIFASCATQVSAASISYVNKWDSHGTGSTTPFNYTISDSPSNVGNLLVVFTHSANAVTVSGIAGGGVGSWTKVTAYSGGGTPGNIEMWRGVVTTSGSGTITVSYSGAPGVYEIGAEEFTMGSANGTWAIDTSGTSTTTSSVTTVNYPSLTPANSSELYTGYAYGGGTMNVGSPTSGFTYVATGATKYLAYNTNVTGGIAYAPVAQQTSGVYASVAAVIAAYTGASVIVDSTATQEANFNVQAATGGTVAGILQAASSGSADILQAKDSSGNNILSVNGSVVGGITGATLGTAGIVGGELNFAASGNTNIISVVAPVTPGSSYSLTLPTTTPAAGQCLATSPSNANQLVFSSCANQVTSVAISLVSNWKSSTVTLNPTLSVSPTNLGDLMTLFIYSSKSNTVNSVSGGGVTTWSKIVGANSEEMWRGIVTSTGSNTIAVSVSTPSSPTEELAAQEWTTGSTNGSWVIDASSTISNAGSATVTYPNLTPQSTKDLYIGYAIGTSTMSAGSTPGYTYFAGAGADMYGAYNAAISAGTQPTAGQSGSSTSIAAGALIAAYSSSSVISNSTVTQEANFNIQAATSNSVAGVLQAAGTGTGDVLDILNATGTIVDKFTSTGNLLIQPSTASAGALQVQTTVGVNVFSVDTTASSPRVVIGSGATGEVAPTLLVLDSQTGSSADPTGVNGSMYYNATTHTLRCYVDGAWQTCTGSMYTNTSNSSANNNCSSNCTAFSINAPIPANYCQPGRVFKVNASGYFSSQSSPSNLQFGIYYGTDGSTAANDVLIGTMSPAVSVSSASGYYFQLNQTIICFSTSSMQANGTVSMQTAGGNTAMTVLPIGASTGATVSSTSAKNFYIFPQWDTATTSNTATLTQLTVNAY